MGEVRSDLKSNIADDDYGSSYFEKSITGRFRKITVEQMVMAWSLYRSRDITRRQLRVYFALHEMSERRRYSKGTYTFFGVEELQRLVGGRGSERSAEDLASDLRKLAKVHLVSMDAQAITFAKKIEELKTENTDTIKAMLCSMPHLHRAVPVPRRMLRALAGGLPKSSTAVSLAIMIRSLFWKAKEQCYRTDGRTKLCWISEVFGISRRAATDGHDHLLHMGWISSLEMTVWQRNRWGLHDRVNVDWKANAQVEVAKACNGSENSPKTRELSSDSASPNPDFPVDYASPDQTKKLSNENLTTRKPGENPRPHSGVSKKPDKQQGRGDKVTTQPRLHDVRFEDLRETGRLLQLYEQAANKGHFTDCEGNRLEFVALAERALTRGKNPPAMFVWLLRSWKTTFITQADEDAARRRLAKHDHNLQAEQRDNVVSSAIQPEQTVEEVFVKKCLAIARDVGGIDPYHVANQIKNWSREEWECQLSVYEFKDRQYWAGIGNELEVE